MPTPTPTPTQEELDRAAVGDHVVVKDYDQSGLDTEARPADAPPPELPDRPEVEPPAANATTGAKTPAAEVERTVPRRETPTTTGVPTRPVQDKPGDA